MVITEFFESCFLQNVVCLLCFQICPEILRVSLRFQSRKLKPKELTLCHKLWFSNPNIFGTQCRKPLIFQTYIFWSNKSHSLRFQRFTTSKSKDIGIRKSEFVAKSQFLCKILTKSVISPVNWKAQPRQVKIWRCQD